MNDWMKQQLAATEERAKKVDEEVEKRLSAMTPGEIVKVAHDWLDYLEGAGMHIKRRRRGNLVAVARAALAGKFRNELRSKNG